MLNAWLWLLALAILSWLPYVNISLHIMTPASSQRWCIYQYSDDVRVENGT